MKRVLYIKELGKKDAFAIQNMQSQVLNKPIKQVINLEKNGKYFYAEVLLEGEELNRIVGFAKFNSSRLAYKMFRDYRKGEIK